MGGKINFIDHSDHNDIAHCYYRFEKHEINVYDAEEDEQKFENYSVFLAGIYRITVSELIKDNIDHKKYKLTLLYENLHKKLSKDEEEEEEEE